MFASNSSGSIEILSLYCFNKLKVGNLKFPNSKVGSNSPKSLTNFSDKFSFEDSSSPTSSTSILTSSSTTFSSSFISVCKTTSSKLSFSSFSSVLFTSEKLLIVGCKFVTDFSNLDSFSVVSSKINSFSITGSSMGFSTIGFSAVSYTHLTLPTIYSV